MSYSIELKDPVTKEVATVPGHLMTGGTYKADYHPETDSFTPALNTEAELNITYNYGSYYYEARPEEGIRSIYGKTGFESIAILEEMIHFIQSKYKSGDEWITTKREESICYDPDGNVITDPLGAILNHLPHETRTEVVDRYEGPASNYWNPTAANALRPLYQLRALAQMRPDGIWDGD